MARGGRIIWLNGAFGVGKSTVAERLVERPRSATVVDPELDEIIGGLRGDAVAVHHFTLVADEQVVAKRLRGRCGDVAWARQRIARCVGALSRSEFAEHLDADHATPMELADRIACRVQAVAS
jgi:dephospho-CoA kinase